VKAKKPKSKDGSIPYRKYIIEAIRELKERTGSSIPAISKYILEHHKEVKLAALTVQLRVQLKRMVQEGLLKKVKASFLLTDKAKKGPKKAKKPKVKKAKKPKAKKPKAKKPKKKTEKKEKKPKKKTEKPKKKAEKKVKKEKPKKVTKPKAAKKEKPKKVAAPKKAKK
jgi:hypothetical protein